MAAARGRGMDTPSSSSSSSSSSSHHNAARGSSVNKVSRVKQSGLLRPHTATDAQGRPRFHGAFTGGFSAGFFNRYVYGMLMLKTRVVFVIACDIDSIVVVT